MAIFLGYNAKTSARTKHIDIKYHYVREHIVDGKVQIKFVKSEDNRADPYTKNVSKILHERHRIEHIKDRNEEKRAGNIE